VLEVTIPLDRAVQVQSAMSDAQLAKLDRALPVGCTALFVHVLTSGTLIVFSLTPSAVTFVARTLVRALA
jgi:hypothetical protein